MAKLYELEKYLCYEFSSGPYTGQDYKSFQTKYINYLRGLCKANGWTLASVGRNHYEFSAFIMYENKYVYLSISDVRFFKNDWHNDILVRTANGERDFRGGENRRAMLPHLQSAVKRLLGGVA